MAWVQLVTEDVLSEFTLSEAAALRQLQGSGSGSGLPFLNIDLITARVVDEVRGYIEAGDYTLDVFDNTLPLSLFEDAIAIARWRYLIATPSLRQLQTIERQEAYQSAIKKLGLIAQQKFTVEPPVPETTPRTGNWNSENKLIMRTHPVPPPATQFPPVDGEWANTGQPSAIVPVLAALYNPNIVALRSGTNSLEALSTMRLSNNTMIMIVINLSESSWQLVPGPADITNPDGEVQPLDFNVDTNNQHWVKVGGL